MLLEYLGDKFLATTSVTFDVPIDMNYDDTSQNLHIHLKAGEQKLDGDKAEYFISKCLSMTQWTKDGNSWNPLLNANGSARLPELETHPEIGFDVYFEYVKEVISPVFIESKTFRNLTSE